MLNTTLIPGTRKLVPGAARAQPGTCSLTQMCPYYTVSVHLPITTHSLHNSLQFAANMSTPIRRCNRKKASQWVRYYTQPPPSPSSHVAHPPPPMPTPHDSQLGPILNALFPKPQRPPRQRHRSSRRQLEFTDESEQAPPIPELPAPHTTQPQAQIHPSLLDTIPHSSLIPGNLSLMPHGPNPIPTP